MLFFEELDSRIKKNLHVHLRSSSIKTKCCPWYICFMPKPSQSADTPGRENYFQVSFWPWLTHILWKTNSSTLMTGQEKVPLLLLLSSWHVNRLHPEFQRNHHLHWGKVFAPDDVTVSYAFWHFKLLPNFCGRFHGTRQIVKKFSSQFASSKNWLNRRWNLWKDYWNQARLHKTAHELSFMIFFRYYSGRHLAEWFLQVSTNSAMSWQLYT